MRFRHRLLSMLLIMTMVISLSGNAVPGSGIPFISEIYAAGEDSDGNVVMSQDEAGSSSEQAAQSEENNGSDDISASENEEAEIEVDAGNHSGTEEADESADSAESEESISSEGSNDEDTDYRENSGNASQNDVSGSGSQDSQGSHNNNAQTGQDDFYYEDQSDAASVNSQDQYVVPQDTAEFEQTLPVLMEEIQLYDEKGNPLESTARVNEIWNKVFGRIPLTALDRDPEYVFTPDNLVDNLLVSVTGNFAPGVTARAGVILYSEEELYSETALASIDLYLYDANGNPYIPQGPVTVELGGRMIKNAVKKEMPLLIYSCEDNPVRTENTKEYSADVLVYRDGFGEDERIRYSLNEDKDSIIFLEDPEGLRVYEDNTADFVAQTLPHHLILSRQVTERTLRAGAKGTDTKVEVSGALSGSTSASVSQADAAGYKLEADTDGSGLLAVDISLESDGTASGKKEEFLPDLPVTVKITDDTIGEALSDNGELEIWQVSGDKSPEKIEDAQFNDNSVEFISQGTMSYVIVQTKLEKTLEASDGKVYRITVSYDQNAGIPANAELKVSEIKEGTPEYDEYVKKSVQKLGKSAEEVSFAKFFDITLRDPETGTEYQPNQNVNVTIELLDTELKEDTQVDVLHFGDEVEQMDCTVNGEAVTFEANGFSVYAIVSTVLRHTLTASDGNEYLVTVTFDNASGIPSDAELYVSEIKEGDAGYDKYVKKTASALGEKPENLAFARPFDITLKKPGTGEVCQPDENVQVKIQLLKDDLNNYDSVDVVHIHGKGEKQVDIIKSTVRGESVEFNADGFSVYVLTGSNGETVTPQCTYTFWIPNPDAAGYKEYAFTDSQGRTIYRQIVTKGEELIVPQPVSTEESVFAGWYKGVTDGAGGLILDDEPYDFGNITITENSAVDLYAVYTNYAAVVFHDQYDSESRTFPVAYTRRGELVTTGEGDAATTSAKIKISDLSTTYMSKGGPNMAFFGWSETPITTPGSAKDDNGDDVVVVPTDEEGCISVAGEKHLYPIYKEIHWLTYYAAQSGLGASYVPPAQFFKGDAVSYDENGTTVYSLPTTSRDGYEFLGWWTGTLTTHGEVETVNYGSQITESNGSLVPTADDAGVYISNGKLYLRSDVTLYAKWQASYSIVYWKQVTTDTPDTVVKHYEYAETVTRTAQIGDTVSVAEEDRPVDKYVGYVLGRYDAHTVIGNTKEPTALNVYYDLESEYEASTEPHTLRFEDSVSGTGTSENLPKEYSSIRYGTSLLTGNEGDSYVPADPVSGRRSDSGNTVYNFSGWYMDQACTIRVFFETPNAEQLKEIDGQKYVVVTDMPDHDMTVYAGWTAIKFGVDIDPNYGALYYEDSSGKLQGTGATYFNNTYEADPIGEYKHVTRDYAESSSGTWYFVNHDRKYAGPDRYTYYTQNPALATEDTTFEYAPGVYTYVGWYEVFLDEDGNEIGEASEPYDFSQHTDHNTKLRLHWKKAGTYYLAYDAGDGTLEDGKTSVLLPEGYADFADVVLTKSASAPAGYTFTGWQVRGSDSSVIYKPGQTFTLHADDAKRVSGKDVVYLDAVYVKVGTASIVYDANGGMVSASGVNFGKIPGSGTDSWDDASGTIDTTKGTATVSGLTNNTKFKLSDGTGFTAPEGSDATFLGWSDKAVCDDSAAFFPKEENNEKVYAVNTAEPFTLYAVWGAQVSYNLNSEHAEWGQEWDSTIYTLDEGSNVYSQSVNIGSKISEPENVPVYNDGDHRLFRYWATRSGAGTTEDPTFKEYDFSQPVTGALDLYAYWSEPNTIKVHAVDASGETLIDKTDAEAEGWKVKNVTVSATETVLDGTSHVTAVPENYEFAFAAVSGDLSSVSAYNEVTAIKYENKKVKVKYIGESQFRVLGEDRELYFVYYQKKALNIGYKSMESNGVLNNVEASGAPGTTGETLLGTYNMSENITSPLNYVTGFSNYAFSAGSADPGSGTQMNASNLSIITDTAGSDDPVPTLRIRNTWRGFEYTTESGNDAEWISCGYEPQLYVIYYTQKPTVVKFDEKTVGTSAVMDTEFTYDLLVTEATTTTVSEQKQKLVEGEWTNDGDPVVTTRTGEPVTIFDTKASGNHPYIHRDGQENSSILFYSETTNTDEGTDDGTGSRTVTTTTVVTAQTAEITQEAHPSFTTSINGITQENEPYRYTFTTDGTGSTQNVTFTNTHKALPVEVHVAMVENDGSSGGILQRDTTFRSAAEADYKFDLELGASEEFLTKLPSPDLFTGDADTYAFGAVMYGTGSEGSAITVGSMDVASIAYAKIRENVYELVLKDSDGNTLGELGSNKLYYLYYPMPKIRYVKEAADGTLTDITGCLINPTTGSIEESDSVTYSHALLTMNGKTVTQNESFEIPLSGFVISQSGNNFRMPPVLDDGLSERYLSYVKLGAGSGGATNSSDLDVSDNLTLQLKVQDNTLKYSFDGKNWKNLTLAGTPTIYAIYTERGYDLQISKTVDTSQSGENAIFSESSFTVTISSTAITKDSYDAEGAESSTIAATPASGTTPGSISFTVEDGTKVRIKGLGHGDYTITESGNENYTLTTKTGPIVSGSTSPIDVVDNSSVSFTFNTETKVELTNSPKAICRIEDRYFYTLRSMVEYVEDEIPTKTATAEMLTDYLMPKADTVEIPSDCNITLTTAESVGHVAVITRSSDLAGVPLFTNNGTLALTNLTLEGSSIEATAPMIQSAGNLTIGSGATVQNCVGGGAINASAGDINVSGTIQNCSAADGGAIYHSGYSNISLTGTGSIQNNTATSGNGGAIWLADGTIDVSGSSRITGNKAESGNGGAIYSDGIVEVKIYQGGSITGNTAKEGGAIYAQTGTIEISETEGVTVKPAVTGNTATSGSGGAIYVGTGSVTVSGGSMSNNKAESGSGGAIYANTAPVTISGTAEVKNNRAGEGGAVYTVSGAVDISGGTVESNTAATGNGGAICAGSGNVTMSGGSMSKNNAAAGSGGAVYADSGNVIMSGCSLLQNTANTDGGAVFAGSGSITVSVSEGGTAPTIQENTATNGKGGALCAETGTVSVDGAALAKNTAGSDGGAVYTSSGDITITNSVFGGDTTTYGNTSGGSGGAVYTGSGNVTVSGGSMQNNKSTGGNGGALYAGSGVVTFSGYTENNVTAYTQLSGNSAAAGKGGAIYLHSGSLTLTSVTATGNSAINGSAIFSDTGRATFNAGSYTGNVASNGGAVGAGSIKARLFFNGDVQIKDNTLGTGNAAPKSNVYLDQDDDAVINIDTLGTGASIGIYVADSVENTRGVPGMRFAVYINNTNVNKITNDRYASLEVQSDTAAKKLYWGNSIKVSVHTLNSYGRNFSQPADSGAGTQLGKYDKYYPEFSEAAISELASELVIKNKLNIGTKVYAGAYLDGARSFGDYITQLMWDKNTSEWYVTTRSGDRVYLKKTDGTGYHRIYIYYAEPAYLSIENNTDMDLALSDMTVDGTSVINSSTAAGYGMVFAKNGAIRSALLPVTQDDLQLSAGQSISLLIPGGQNKAYTLNGIFGTTEEGSVRLRRGAEGSLSEDTVTFSSAGVFDQLSGTTLNTSGTYQIIFGEDKNICKVVDADGVEHPYGKISTALADILATEGNDPPYTLATAKTATIEMLTDYLQPASDHVLIPRGYDITLTTAAPAGTEGVTYTYRGMSEDDRAVISRDTENKYSMIDAWNSAWNYAAGTGTDNVTALDGTVLRINNLVFDGKSVRGESDGGAVASKYVNVYVDNVDFKNVYASNGGAMLIMFSAKDKNNKVTVPGTVMDVRNCQFTGCTSWTTEKSNRLGGGAIVTNAERMYLIDSEFTGCTAVDQAGAVFHRVDANYDSWTEVSGCTFTNCSANAAGGLELDSKTINVSNCTFEHCVANERNGGGFNVWPLNSGTPTADCWVTLTGCSFLDCQALKQNGGGFRSAAVYTTVNDCTFTNTSGAQGGGIAMSNTNAKEGKIFGCTFDRCAASNQGGGFYCVAVKVEIGDYLYPSGEAPTTAGAGSYIRDENGAIIGRHSEIKNCTSSNEGGGIYHGRNANGSSLTITNAAVSGNQVRNNGKNGGGIFTNARKVIIDGCSITDNKSTSTGGGVYDYASGAYSNNSDSEFHNKISMIVRDSTISRNTASGNGGGVWFDANDDTNRAKQVLTIKGSSIESNTSGAAGGGIYTLAKTVTIGASETATDSDGNAIRSSVSNNTAKTNGGGIYQKLNVNGSVLTISNANVNGNTANNTNTGTDNGGGGIYAGVRTLTLTESTVSNNAAKSNGGGILFEINNDDSRNAMSVTIEGCTLNGNTSNANGGGIYTKAKTADIKGHTEGTGDSAVTTPTTISNCTANYSGGGLYQNRDVDGSTLTVKDSVISGCRSNDSSNATDPPRGGGGIMANVRTITVTGSEIKNNTAVKNGGGIDAPSDGTSMNLIIDNSKITGNTAGNMGGGIYTRSQLSLRNDTEITGNRLNSNAAANCAGVYLSNGRTLFVGPETAAEGFTDTIKVHNNTTTNGTLSDLRLWDDGSENDSHSAYVYCDLSNDSEIRVVNAAKVSTWFGSSEIKQPNGFSDDNAVFKADSSTLHGIIDRTDPEMKKIIWAGPPIAKLTDSEGNLLYLKYNENTAAYPAIFDRLDTGDRDSGSPVSPFSLLRMDNLTLYYKDGSTYTGSDYCIKMLVEHYETNSHIILLYKEGRNVTFTTAQKSDSDYPYEGAVGGRSTVIRGSGVGGNNNLLNVEGNLAFTNIFIDGGSANGISSGTNTRNLQMGTTNGSITVTLGEGAVLQNARATSEGGGVNVTNNASFEIRGGVIRNCSTSKDGGGVYLNGGTMVFEAGSIYQCSADNGSGGGVRIKSGTMNMSGGTISGCSANNGGGVYVGGGHTLNMSGGSIINNNAKSTGGGVAIYDRNARLYFSRKVNVSGNTCVASVAANKACNVELNQDSNYVINTNNGGLYPGAYIGVYVNNKDSNYEKHGVERKPFGTFANGDSTTNLYSFVNDRNGLKGGIIENPDPNTIYWIKIFSLEVSKEVISGNSTLIDENESFLFKVNIRGTATVPGQLNPAQIDSDSGEYGEMHFDSNGEDTTTAVFALKNGDSITGVNLSEGLTYEVIEYLTVDQARRYAALPMKGYRTAPETLTVDGTTYTVIEANTYTSKIGENKNRTDVDPYTSSLTFTNLMPVCKITDHDGNLLYRKYNWDKVTNEEAEGPDGGSTTDEKQPVYFAPAVYTELTGDDGAFNALEGTLYSTLNSNYPTIYGVENGVRIQMLIGEYSLNEFVTVDTGKVTLCTASGADALFPKQDSGTTSTIRRAFAGNSMFNVSSDLTLETIILDGAKGSYTASTYGGIANVPGGGKLTIQDGATLQNSKTILKGGAVYVATGGVATMTGGIINKNESVSDGAGIYLTEGSTLNLSGSPGFGGTGRDVSGNITTANGNFKTDVLIAETNGGKHYEKARQDIFIAESQDNPASVVLTGNLNVDSGSIWIWAENENHYAMMKPFALIDSGTVNGNTYAAFRNARPDSVTNCGEDNYLTGSSGENPMFVYWAGGFDISFTKIDGFGEVQSDAVFTLYTDLNCTEAAKQGGADITAVSADGTDAYKDKSGTKLDKGKVLFEQIPAGVYYMKETTVPEGYVNALSKDSDGNPISNVYVVLVGEGAMQGAGTGVLADITQEQITAQTGTGDDKRDAVIFLVDPETQSATAVPDIARYGIMNISTLTKKAVFKKIDQSGLPLEGAVFEVLRFDRTKVTGKDTNGKTVTEFTSGKNGIYFLDFLPYGIYYIHEIKVPDGYNALSDGTNWYKLRVDENGVMTVDENGANSSGPLTEEP